jgi:hypothetical protein
VIDDASNLSRAVSHALRHEPWFYELELDAEGWASVDDVVAGLRSEKPGKIKGDRVHYLDKLLVSGHNMALCLGVPAMPWVVFVTMSSTGAMVAVPSFTKKETLPPSSNYFAKLGNGWTCACWPFA